MNIDLTNLITNKEDKIQINIKINYPQEKLNTTNIIELKDTTFVGEISKTYNEEFILSGILKGIMILPDDITLENTEVNFSNNIEEKITNQNNDNLTIIQNKLDISDFLWQNILVEVPLKVVNKKNEDLTLNGDGWRLITEEQLNENNNWAFAELKEKFVGRKE